MRKIDTFFVQDEKIYSNNNLRLDRFMQWRVKCEILYTTIWRHHARSKEEIRGEPNLRHWSIGKVLQKRKREMELQILRQLANCANAADEALKRSWEDDWRRDMLVLGISYWAGATNADSQWGRLLFINFWFLWFF